MPDDLIIGIDLGGTHYQIGAVDAAGTVHARRRGHTPDGGAFEDVTDALAASVESLCDELGTEVCRMIACGIGAPGAAVPKTGVILQAGNLPWNDVPLGDVLSRKLGGMRVVVDNDVNAATVGEHRLGAGRGATDMLGVWIGTGIGGGFILNNRLHRGTYFSAGEIGQTVPDPDGKAPHRILERQAARSAIARRIAERKGAAADEMTSRRIAELHAAKDRDALAVLDDAAMLIGVTCANAITLLSLGRVVVGGGIVERMGDAFIRPIAEAAYRDVFPDECRKTPFVKTALGDNAGLLGASIIARDALA